MLLLALLSGQTTKGKSQAQRFKFPVLNMQKISKSFQMYPRGQFPFSHMAEVTENQT